MRTVYLMEDEFQYNCPYCGVEIIDYSKDKMETEDNYCGRCGQEYHIDVAEYTE